MKKLFTILGITFATFLVTDNSAHTYQSGAPAGRTGSPGDGSSCTVYCHSGPSVTDQFITISMIENTPREYTITIQAQSETPFEYTKAGFQACIEDASGTKIGNLSILSNTLTKIVNQHYITHTTLGTSPSEEFSGSHHAWSFNWSAPDDFVGEATVYTAVMLTNNDGSNSGDVHLASNYTFNVGLGLDEVYGFDFSVYPNPVSEQINLVFETPIEEDTSISLIDMKGAEIVLHQGFLSQKEYNLVLPAGLVSGVYAIRIDRESGQSSKRIILQ